MILECVQYLFYLQIFMVGVVFFLFLEFHLELYQIFRVRPKQDDEGVRVSYREV